MAAGDNLFSILQHEREELVNVRGKAINDRDDRQREMFDADLNLKAARKELGTAMSRLADAQRKHKALIDYCDDGTNSAPQYLLNRSSALTDAVETARKVVEPLEQRVSRREEQLAEAQRAHRLADDAFNDASRNIIDLDRRIQSLNEVRADHSVNGRNS